MEIKSLVHGGGKSSRVRFDGCDGSIGGEGVVESKGTAQAETLDRPWGNRMEAAEKGGLYVRENQAGLDTQKGKVIVRGLCVDLRRSRK